MAALEGRGGARARICGAQARALGSWMKFLPEAPPGGNSPVTACFSASMMVCGCAEDGV